jgi:hypothetical protein
LTNSSKTDIIRFEESKMEYLAFHSTRDYLPLGNPYILSNSIYASTWEEAARSGGAIYLVAPYAYGMGQSRVVLGDFGWRSSAVTAVAGPWRNDDERGMIWAAAIIAEEYNKGHQQIPGILLWAATLVPIVPPEMIGMTVEWGINHKNSMMRYLATRAAGHIGAISSVMKALGDKSEEVQAAAIEAAETIGPDALQVVERAIKSRNPSIRRRATTAARRMGDRALSILQSAMEDSDVDVRITAVFVARLIGPSAFPILERASSDKDARVRVEAMLDADQFGPPALQIIEKGLKDRDRRVREAAREALNRMRGRG